jgi:hypothetical protein
MNTSLETNVIKLHDILIQVHESFKQNNLTNTYFVDSDFFDLSEAEFKDHVLNYIDDEELLLVSAPLHGPNHGFWFRWELYMGSVFLTMPGNVFVRLPLLPFNEHLAEEHSAYILMTLEACLTGKIRMHVSYRAAVPHMCQIVYRANNKSYILFTSSKDENPATGEQLKIYANNTNFSYVNNENRTTVKRLFNSMLISLTTVDDYDSPWDSSYWGLDDEIIETEQNSSPSLWWFFIAACLVFIGILFLITLIPTLRAFIGGENIITVSSIVTMFILLGIVVVFDKPIINNFLIRIDRYIFNPLNALLVRIGRFLHPLVATSWRRKLTLFIGVQAALCLMYVYDNCYEVTTNRILSYAEMVNIHPIMWLNPIFQLASLLFFFTKKWLLFDITVLCYIFFNLWASLGGVIYSDVYPGLPFWQSVADWILGFAVFGVVCYAIYIPIKLLGSSIASRTTNARKKAWAFPNIAPGS